MCTVADGPLPLGWLPAGPSQELSLFPVPIGTSIADAPVQQTELINPTDMDISYEVRAGPATTHNPHRRGRKRRTKHRRPAVVMNSD